jgi:hypothetical protein
MKEQNNTIKKSEEGLLLISMMYKPSDLIAKQQMIKETRTEFDSLVQIYNKYLYFTIEITQNGKDLETAFASNLAGFADGISYLSGGFGSDIKMISAKDTIELKDFVYARSYGLGPSRFLVAFEKPNADNFTIYITAHPINIGRHRFSFSRNDLESVPALKF